MATISVSSFQDNLMLLDKSVANIAKNYLEEHNKSAHDKVEKTLLYLWDSDPHLMPYEDSHHFVESATFADDIKYHGHAW